MTLYVKTSQGAYEILIQRGALHRAGEVFNLSRKVMIVTDSGVPEDYAMTIASQCDEAVLFVFEQGESSKTLTTYSGILEALTMNAFTRADCVVAVGGGVVGDMAGFAAATYMRGIDFYNVPTTLLSQVDSSIGGKTAIDFSGYKNLVGAFYPPMGVLIDLNVLQTLPSRHISNGMAEVIKMAMTHDEDLFALLEDSDSLENIIDGVIPRALAVKKQVVESDERENGVRKVLNFGHTLGHAIESVNGLDTYFHGECVALGMIPMCSPVVRERLLPLLKKYRLPTRYTGDIGALLDAARHDKKTAADTITVIYVPQIGTFEMKTIPFVEYEEWIREVTAQ